MTLALISILEAGKAVAPYIPVAIETARRIKASLEKSGDFTVEIKDIAEDTVELNTDTMKLIQDWLAQNSKE